MFHPTQSAASPAPVFPTAAWDADAILGTLLAADLCSATFLPTTPSPRPVCGPALKRIAACTSCKGTGRRIGTNRGFTARVTCGCRNGFVDLRPVAQLCVVPATAEQVATLPAKDILRGMVVAPGFATVAS